MNAELTQNDIYDDENADGADGESDELKPPAAIEGFSIERVEAVPLTVAEQYQRRRSIYDDILDAFIDSGLEVARAAISWTDDNPTKGQVGAVVQSLRYRIMRRGLSIQVFMRNWDVYLAVKDDAAN